jgi:hypothetical protein
MGPPHPNGVITISYDHGEWSFKQLMKGRLRLRDGYAVLRGLLSPERLQGRQQRRVWERKETKGLPVSDSQAFDESAAARRRSKECIDIARAV